MPDKHQYEGIFYYSTHLAYLVCVYTEYEGKCMSEHVYLRYHVSIRGCKLYGIAVQIDARHPSVFHIILHTTSGLSCISLTV